LIAGVGCGKDPLAFDLTFPPVLAGIVTNRVTNAPISGVLIRCQGKTALTATNGAYDIHPLEGGTFPVTATHPDYVEGARDIEVRGIGTEGNFQLQPKS